VIEKSWQFHSLNGGKTKNLFPIFDVDMPRKKFHRKVEDEG